MVKEIIDKRNIKQIGNVIKPGDFYIHPITLQIRKIDKSSKSFVPTEFHFNPEGKLELDTYADNINTENLSKKELQLQMLLPKTVYNEANILHIYDIKNIELLNNFVIKEISKNTLFETINRMINAFTLYKFEEFKKNNNSLVEIYKKLIKHYKKIDIENKKISKLIVKYLSSDNYNSFDFNLGEYIMKNI